MDANNQPVTDDCYGQCIGRIDAEGSKCSDSHGVIDIYPGARRWNGGTKVCGHHETDPAESGQFDGER